MSSAPSSAPSAAPATVRSTRPAWIGLGVALALIAASMLVPFLAGWQVWVDFPPLHANWAPRLGPGTLPAIALAVLAVAFSSQLAERVRWSWLLVLVFVVGLAWLISLALVDGLDGIGVVLGLKSEYLTTANGVTDLGATLREYVARIPLDAPHHWPIHLAGHPPGALLFFVALAQLGLGSGLAAGFAVAVIAATTPVAVLLTARRLGAEQLARRVAPFLVIGSAAIWLAVSADAMFGAAAAWALCLLAVAATSGRRVVAILAGVTSGLLFGYCVMLSYGLPLLAVLAIAVLWLSRNWWPILWAGLGALLVVGAFAAAGFAWWEAYPVLAQRYWSGIAADRPYQYWVWANLAALAISAGPMVGASLGTAFGRLPTLRSAQSPDRVIVLLTLAAAVCIVLADLSGMSKAEVERIWLPFVPWLLLATALLPQRWRMWGLAGQAAFALLVQHLFLTTW